LEFHGIEMKGEFILEMNALPAWTAADEGRIIYDTTNDIMYIGGSADWVKMADDAALQTHIGNTGTAVHGLGTMSTQNANNVSITGGSVKLTSGTTISEFSIDGTFAGNSDDVVPTEKAVKTYTASYTAANVFPSSTKMLFTQASAPTGWVRDETYSHSSYKGAIMLANTGGTGALTGGSWDLIGKSMSHLHSTSSHSLTYAEMPSHTHAQWKWPWRDGAGSGTHSYAEGSWGGSGGATYIGNGVGYSGGSNAHGHGNTGSSGVILNPRYLTVIVAVKS